MQTVIVSDKLEEIWREEEEGVFRQRQWDAMTHLIVLGVSVVLAVVAAFVT